MTTEKIAVQCSFFFLPNVAKSQNNGLNSAERMLSKLEFEFALNGLASTLANHVSADDGQWTVKGFIDVFKNVYTISSDTKIISKILEIHLLWLKSGKLRETKEVLATRQISVAYNELKTFFQGMECSPQTRGRVVRRLLDELRQNYC